MQLVSMIVPTYTVKKNTVYFSTDELSSDMQAKCNAVLLGRSNNYSVTTRCLNFQFAVFEIP